jgi:parvulin-like peptidyl-prolyl isomerase
MTEGLDLSLPKRKQKAPQAPKGQNFLLGLLLLALLVNMIVVYVRTGAKDSAKSENSHVLSAENQKKLALKMEKQGLQQVSAAAWREYIARASLEGEDAARIWYRIGNLYAEALDYAQALEAYYRSESFAEVTELSPEIARRSQECLEKMGKFAALRYELADRVSMDKEAAAAGDEIVAEIGSYKITKAELDRQIENHVQRQISQYAAFLPEEEVQKQKESILRQLSSSAQRLQMLNQFIVEEVLYRKARESKLVEEADVRNLLLAQERKLLAQQVMEKELADKIQITPGDLNNYYEAHKSQYMQTEGAQISHILVASEDEAKAALESVKAGEDFSKLAQELSTDEATKEQGGEISGWIDKNAPIPGLGNVPEASDLILQTEADQVCENYVKSEQGFHIIKVRERRAERQKDFDEVRQEVFRALRSQKEREVQTGLLEELKNRYDVVIHHSAFEKQTEETTN